MRSTVAPGRLYRSANAVITSVLSLGCRRSVSFEPITSAGSYPRTRSDEGLW